MKTFPAKNIFFSTQPLRESSASYANFDKALSLPN